MEALFSLVIVFLVLNVTLLLGRQDYLFMSPEVCCCWEQQEIDLLEL